ncbi:hypothetical protein MNBD_NITROSPINAE02-1619 [hydrothermal vent metagenome]|uniref:Uncharacterized protein n=1 Tax=hydrothermal vent metagenome TaxID=652676 RepID=A0A3B1C0W3_9ZZZZ
MRKSMVSRFTLLAAVIVLFQISSCSGGGGGGDSSSSGGGQTTYKSEDVTNTAVANIGSLAGVGIITAADKGYSLRQIADAVMANNLSQSGDISGQSPTLAPQGFISRSSGAGVQNRGKGPQEENFSAKTYVETLEANKYAATALIIAMAVEGYSTEQITLALISVDVTKCANGDNSSFTESNIVCIVLLLANMPAIVGEPTLAKQGGIFEGLGNDGGSSSGGDTGDDSSSDGDSGSGGCYLDNSTLPGTWSKPGFTFDDAYYSSCVAVINANHTWTTTCTDDEGDTDYDSGSWSLDCNSLSFDGEKPWTVLNSSTFQIYYASFGVTFTYTRQ